MRDELARPLGPVGAPPLRVALQICVCDRINRFGAKVADEEAPNHRGLAFALIRPPLASLHLTQDLRDVLLGYGLKAVGAGGEALFGPVGGLVPDGVSPALSLRPVIRIQRPLDLPLPSHAEAHLPPRAACALKQLKTLGLVAGCGAHDEACLITAVPEGALELR
jgi:hypothetical protein